MSDAPWSAALGNELRILTALPTKPVAVYLIPSQTEQPEKAGFRQLESHRWCQALMHARHGKSVRLEGRDCTCPAAAAAFGFKPLPEGLADGTGLVGFGIVRSAATGRNMFLGMPHLPSGAFQALEACPLSDAPSPPDVIVLEGPPESLMWVALADLDLEGGARRRADTAVLQATCVDVVVIPYLERRLNFSLGCYGCREATDLRPGEAVLGFPGDRLPAIVAALRALQEKAIPRSRAKAVYQHHQEKENSHEGK